MCCSLSLTYCITPLAGSVSIYFGFQLSVHQWYWCTILVHQFETNEQKQMKLAISYTVTSSLWKDTKWWWFFFPLLILNLSKSTLMLKSVRLNYSLSLHHSFLVSLISHVPDWCLKLLEITKHVSSLRSGCSCTLVWLQLILFCQKYFNNRKRQTCQIFWGLHD